MKFLLMPVLISALVILPITFSGCSSGTSSETEKATSFERCKDVVFEVNYQNALKIAFEESKPLLVFFTEKTCVFSQKMKKEVFTDPEIVRLSRNFVCVEIDINSSENQDLCAELNIPGSPTVQFMSSSGRPYQCMAQFQPKEELVRQMEVVLYSVAWKTN